MKHYFLDTNVVIDFLAHREPFAETALALFRAALAKQATLYVASLSFSNVYYILRKSTSPAVARDKLNRLEKLVTILSVDASIIRLALASSFADYEDGIQHFAAQASPSVTAIVTRDFKDFQASVLPVISPAQALLEIQRF